MFCEKCGSPLDANAKFCTACGSAVNNADNGQTNQTFGDTVQQTQNFANNGFNQNAGFDPNSNYNAGNNFNQNNNFDPNYGYNNNNVNNNGFNNFQQPAAKPKKSKAPVIIGVVAILLVALVGGYFAFGKSLLSKLSAKKDPVKRTMTSLSNIGKSEAVDFETSLKLKLSGEGGDNVLIKDLVEGIAVKINGKYVKAGNQAEYNISVVYKNAPIVALQMYVDKELIVISSEELLDQPLYANIKDLEELMAAEGAPAGTIDIAKYEAIGKELEKNADYKKLSEDYKLFFETILKEFVVAGESAEVKVNENGKDRTVKTDELTMTIDDKFIQKVVVGLLEKVADDKNLKPFVLEAMNKFYETAKENGDLEKFGMDEDEFKEAIDDMDSEWDNAMAEMKDGMAQVEGELAALDFKSEAVFRIDSDGKLRQLVYEIDGGELMGEAMGMPGISGAVVIDTVFNAYDGDVKVKKPSTDGAANLAEMDEYELMSLMGDLQEKLTTIISSQFGGMQ